MGAIDHPNMPLRTTLSRPRRIFFSMLSIALGLAFVLATGEFAVRYISPQALVSDLIIADRDVDYRLKPSSIGRMSSPEYDAEIRINSLGFRGEEVQLAKPPGVRRVLFLGDSFTFGHGIADDETLPHRVGEELARLHPGRYEVINGGVYGYCTANELELFVKYGLPLKPDVVVILVMTHDMADNTLWYEVSRDGKLRRKSIKSQYIESRRITRYIPGASWLREHSHLFKFVGMRVLPVVKSGMRRESVNTAGRTEIKSVVDEFSGDFYKQEAGAFQVTAAILRRFAETAKENKPQFILLSLGGRDEFEMGKMRPARMLPHDKLREAASAAGFAGTLALSPILASYNGDKALFFSEDMHWTAAATHLVAPDVAKLIASLPIAVNQGIGAARDH